MIQPTPLHAANPSPMTGAGNWTYLIPGPAPVLIDAGVGRAEHLDAIAAAAPRGPARVIVTHAHGDHASGAPAVAARWAAAEFMKYPWPARDPRYDVAWRPLADGDRITTSEGELEAVHTPGHAPDHVALWHAPSRSVFAGDLLVLGTTVVIPGSHGGSLTQYLRSLKRLSALKPVRAFPAHGDTIEDPEALIAYYLEHRRQREQQIAAALEPGPVTVDAITAAIYRGLHEALVPMARESVLAHLVKLEEDRIATREGDAWKLAR